MWKIALCCIDRCLEQNKYQTSYRVLNALRGLYYQKFTNTIYPIRTNLKILKNIIESPIDTGRVSNHAKVMLRTVDF